MHILISTGTVFDRCRCGLYRDEDPVAPRGLCGHSKAAAEKSVDRLPGAL
jgi:dTDP-4-dehydrorhamnose reductase